MLVLDIYQNAFQDLRLGYASAETVIMMVLIALFIGSDACSRRRMSMTSATITGPIAGTSSRPSGPGSAGSSCMSCSRIGALLMITPFLWMVLTAFKSDLEIAKFSWLPDELRWQNFVEAMQTAPFLRYFRNSLFIAVGETAFTLAVCTTAGYALAKLPIRGSKALLSYFILLLLVPFQIILVPLFLIVKSIPLFGGNNILGQGGIGWLNSWWGLIIPLGAAPLFTFLARQFYVSIPNELAQAARVDGLGEFGIFWRIMTPLVKPALITICVFQIEAAWNGFLWPLMITTLGHDAAAAVGAGDLRAEPGRDPVALSDGGFGAGDAADDPDVHLRAEAFRRRNGERGDQGLTATAWLPEFRRLSCRAPSAGAHPAPGEHLLGPPPQHRRLRGNTGASTCPPQDQDRSNLLSSQPEGRYTFPPAFSPISRILFAATCNNQEFCYLPDRPVDAA